MTEPCNGWTRTIRRMTNSVASAAKPQSCWDWKRKASSSLGEQGGRCVVAATRKPHRPGNAPVFDLRAALGYPKRSTGKENAWQLFFLFFFFRRGSAETF